MEFRTIALDLHRNNIGITTTSTMANGQLNVWRNSIPADQVSIGRSVTVGGVPFEFPHPHDGAPDNVRCAGQLIDLPPGSFDWLYLLVTAERRVEDSIAFHFTDGTVDFEPLRVSDFWAAPAAFGEEAALATTAMHYPHHVQAGVPATIWCQRVAVTRRTPVRAARLPRNIAVHIFAATLCAVASVADLGGPT